MTGEPLYYRVSPDGAYHIYSAGRDMQDDGGRLFVEPSFKDPDSMVPRPYDIV